MSYSLISAWVIKSGAMWPCNCGPKLVLLPLFHTHTDTHTYTNTHMHRHTVTHHHHH